MDLPDYDEEMQSFDPASHPDNVPLDVSPPKATTRGEPIPEELAVEDDDELADVDIDDTRRGPGQKER